MAKYFRSYNHYNTNVGHNLKLIQITTKYRKPVMANGNGMKEVCEDSIRWICNRHKIDIKALNVQADHVHMIVDCPRTMTDSKLLQLIKGGSSYSIFKRIPGLRKIFRKGHFWSGGYFCCNVGSDYKRTLVYINNQDKKHRA
jgi:putative transposase